jgi:hypothetical protein
VIAARTVTAAHAANNRNDQHGNTEPLKHGSSLGFPKQGFRVSIFPCSV